MINESIIKQELFGIVGFTQPTISEYAIVDTDNLQASSGQRFEGASNLVSVKNIHVCQENKDITTDQFNTYLTSLQNQTIIDTVNKIINDKSKHLETNTLFPYEQDYQKTKTGLDGFVGIRIQPNLNEKCLIKINTIAITLDSAIELPVYLINSETGTALYTTTVTTIANQQASVNVDWNISLNINTSTQNVLGGKYYLGYYTSDLGAAKPIERDYELAEFPIYSNYFDVEFRVMGLNGTRINPNLDESIPEPYGLNMNYSVYVDYTDLIVKNKYKFARAIQLQMAEKVTDLILTSTRTNQVERLLGDNIRNIANYENKTVFDKLNNEIKSIRNDLFRTKRITRRTLI